MKTIYELDFCESVSYGAITFFRVPGGWMVSDYNTNSSTFIPYSKEFEPAKESKDEPPIKDSSKFINSVFDLWNELQGTKFKPTSGRINKIKARLKVFSEEEINKALINRVKFVDSNPWHQQKENKMHKTNMDLLIRNDESLQKWLLYENTPEARDKMNEFKFS